MAIHFTVALIARLVTPPPSLAATVLQDIGTQSVSNASVAQSVEQLTLNQLVLGSNPSRGTFRISELQRM